MNDIKPPTSQVPERAEQVRDMFAQISGRYDLLNRVLSMGVDQSWRVTACKWALAHNPQRILDVATGTADFALMLKKLSPESEVIGCDFVPQMLAIGRQKAQNLNINIRLEEADALNLPYPDSSFDTVTCAFGFRNFANYEQGLKEFSRVLKVGGKVVILEFPPPQKGVMGSLFRFYFENILPRIGALISGSKSAYTYLPESVLAFPTPEALEQKMRAEGFETRYKLLTFGIAAIHEGIKLSKP